MINECRKLEVCETEKKPNRGTKPNSVWIKKVQLGFGFSNQNRTKAVINEHKMKKINRKLWH